MAELLGIEYLAVGGGGGGGETIGGGGGGGAVNTGTLQVYQSDELEISIGLGGLGGFTGVTGAALHPGGYSGGFTRIRYTGFSVITTASGGGAGGGYNTEGTSPAGTGGGQGGGQGAGGGAGVAPGTGLNSGGTSASNTNSGAGGGGAGAVGSNATSGFPGAGGAGIEWPAGSGVYFGGGGGGGARDPSGGTGADGGLGGGGAGGTSANNGTPGTDNTGGGGGGGGYRNSDAFQAAGGAGGSGVVKIRYSGIPKAVGGDIVTSGGYTTHTFNSEGSFTRSAGAVGVQGFLVPDGSNQVFTGSANEGTTVTVKFRSANQTGTINYSITGTVTSADINDAPLSGSVNIVDYEGTLELTISADISIGEGNETLTVSFVENSQTYQDSLTIIDSSKTLSITPEVDSGGTIIVTLNTGLAPQPNGTQIPYTISGTYITEQSIGQPLTGFFTMTNNLAQLTINLSLIDSTTLTIETFGTTASSEIRFTPTFADAVITQTTQPTYQSAMIASLLDGVETPIGNGVPNAQQISDYQVKPIPKPDGEEVMVFQTVTTSFSGKYNQFVNLPLGAELIKEYWI